MLEKPVGCPPIFSEKWNKQYTEHIRQLVNKVSFYLWIWWSLNFLEISSFSKHHVLPVLTCTVGFWLCYKGTAWIVHVLDSLTMEPLHFESGTEQSVTGGKKKQSAGGESRAAAGGSRVVCFWNVLPSWVWAVWSHSVPGNGIFFLRRKVIPALTEGLVTSLQILLINKIINKADWLKTRKKIREDP